MLGGAAYEFSHPGEPIEHFYLHIVWCQDCGSFDFAVQHHNSDRDTSDEYGDIAPHVQGRRGFSDVSATIGWGEIVRDKSDESLPLIVAVQRHSCCKEQEAVDHRVLASVKLSGWSRVCRVPFPSEAVFEVLECKLCGAPRGRKVRRARF